MHDLKLLEVKIGDIKFYVHQYKYIDLFRHALPPSSTATIQYLKGFISRDFQCFHHYVSLLIDHPHWDPFFTVNYCSTYTVQYVHVYLVKTLFLLLASWEDNDLRRTKSCKLTRNLCNSLKCSIIPSYIRQYFRNTSYNHIRGHEKTASSGVK